MDADEYRIKGRSKIIKKENHFFLIVLCMCIQGHNKRVKKVIIWFDAKIGLNGYFLHIN